MLAVSEKLTFLLVAGHPDSRKDLALFFQKGYANATVRTLATYEEIPALLLHNSFDVVILDLQRPLSNSKSVEWIGIIKLLDPHTKVLVFSDGDDAQQALFFISRGADGAMDQRCAAEQIKNAIQSMVLTGRYFSKQLKALLREMYFKNEEDRGLLL